MLLVARQRGRALCRVLLTTLALSVAPGLLFALCRPVDAGSPTPLAEAARRRAEILDDLFAKLKAAPDQASADRLVSSIWAQWNSSGRDDIDVMLSGAAGNIASGNLGLSLILLDEIIAMIPDFAEAWNKRATAHYRMGNMKQALADIEKTLALEPRHFGALAGRAAIHADAKRWKEALESYRAAVALNPFLRGHERVLRVLETRAGERGI